MNKEQHAANLFARISEGRILKRAVIEGGDWQPQPNRCHENVLIWCTYNSAYKIVRGWLYFDLPGINFVKFVAHSAVETPDGELFDITPSAASRDYPFIKALLTEQEFERLVKETENGEIIHKINLDT